MGVLRAFQWRRLAVAGFVGEAVGFVGLIGGGERNT